MYLVLIMVVILDKHIKDILKKFPISYESQLILLCYEIISSFAKRSH